MTVPRALVVLAVALASLLAVGGAAAAILVRTDWGRARVCDILNAQISAFIAGKLVVAGIDEIDLPLVKAHGIKFLDPAGVPAIDVERAEIELDFAAIFAGRFAWHRAKVDGGTVWVTEDKDGKNNMEELFRAKNPQPDSPNAGGKSPLDMRMIRTSNLTLLIGGGSLPTLQMRDIEGVMRIQEFPNGRVELRFDEYSGKFVEGLPTGQLNFRDVKGFVQTGVDRLLRFEGAGESEGEPVRYLLDIFTEPHNLVKIDATFPEVSAESIATLAFAGLTKFTKNLAVTIRHGDKVYSAMSPDPK